jgi:hypothetical protein
MKTITKKIIVFLSFVILLTDHAFATGQEPDHLFYKGKTEIIFNNPLERYFNKQRPKPAKLFTNSVCSAIWRGYIATWEIKKKTLYLVKMVEGNCGKNPAVIPLDKLFVGQKTKVKAEWFSGKLRIQQGKQLRYIDYGYETLYEKEVLLIIEKGLLVGEETIVHSRQQAKKPVLLNKAGIKSALERQSPATEYQDYASNYPNTTKTVIVDKKIHNNIYQISQETGFSIQAILDTNPKIDINNLRVGDEVVLPRIR